MIWLSLATSILIGLPDTARPVALGYIKFNEAFVHYAQNNFANALACLEEGLLAELAH